MLWRQWYWSNFQDKRWRSTSEILNFLHLFWLRVWLLDPQEVNIYYGSLFTILLVYVFGKTQILCHPEFIAEFRWQSCQSYLFIFQYFPSSLDCFCLMRCCWACSSSSRGSADCINLLICEASAYQDTWVYLLQISNLSSDCQASEAWKK